MLKYFNYVLFYYKYKICKCKTLVIRNATHYVLLLEKVTDVSFVYIYKSHVKKGGIYF
jgi:hypothetical protein